MRTKTRLAASIALAVGIATAVVGPLADAAHGQTSAATECVAHRGYTATGATENTTRAVDAAAAAGADRVETDVQFTSTGYPVIMHDDTVDRTTNGTGRVSSMTVTQFTNLRTTDGGHPPTFWAMLHEMDLKGVQGLVELKTNPTDAQWRHLVGKIPSGMRGRFLFQSFDSAATWRALHAGYPALRLLKQNYAGASWTYAYTGTAVEYPHVTKAYTVDMLDHGRLVYAWTVDDHSVVDRLFWDGVTGVITDDTPYCATKRDSY